MAYRAQTEKDDQRLKEPQSLDAEQAVLGSILKSEQALNLVIEILDTAKHFHARKHRFIFEAILNLFERSEPCDITTVAEALSRTDSLKKIGGRVYLVDLVESVSSTANVEAYARIVLEKSIMRDMIATSESIIENCYSMRGSVPDLLDMAESRIFDISQSRHRKGFTALRDLIPSTFEQIEYLQSRDGKLAGTMTGFEKFDNMTNGLHKGELIVIAGRPSMGKSAFVMNVAEHVAVNQKKSVGVFSVEMSSEQLAVRMLCGRARVSQQKLRAGKLNDEEWQRLTRVGGTLSETAIYIDDTPGLNSLEMKAKARRLKAQHGIDLVIVDYIQMMRGLGRFENRQQEIAVISRNLKTLAMELEVPVIACSQLSRQVEQREGKKPQLSDLRESGAIEQDADVVAFVYRPELYLSHLDRTDAKYLEAEGKAHIIVAKQRNGPTGVVYLTFVKDFARFENPAQRPDELPPGAEPF